MRTKILEKRNLYLRSTGTVWVVAESIRGYLLYVVSLVHLLLKSDI